MKYFIYSLSLVFLLQGCGSSDTQSNETPQEVAGNGEDLNAEPQTNPSSTPSTNTTASTPSATAVIDLPIKGTFERINDKEIVKETHSNLFWQDNEEAKTTIKNLPEAKTYCSSLSLGELTGWRVPSYKELMLLVDYERRNSSVDDTFVYTDKKDYWTSTYADIVKSNAKISKAWRVNFADGGTGIDYTGDNTNYSTTQKYVRCVNDSFAKKRAVDHNFTREGNVVRDNIYKLEWQDEITTKRDTYIFTDAEAYCSSLELEGKSDWRVPSMKEMLTTLDVNDFDPASYNAFLHSGYDKPYGTSTERIIGVESVWVINFENGAIHYEGVGNNVNSAFHRYVRCVRDAKGQ